MQKIEYARMSEREANYWWHIGRLKIIETYIARFAKTKKRKLKILNVGCGTGGTIKMLEQFGEVDNVDISDDAIDFMKQKGFHNIVKVEGIELPFKDKTYDIVGAFDVLEHIEDDEAALKEWQRVLKDDGAIILTVPAYMWLWSGHDVSLHHHRRYTTGRLASVAKRAALAPQKKSYAIVFSLPLIVGFRYLNKALGRKADAETSYVNVPDWVNSLFTRILLLEARAHKHMSFWAGTSVIASLQKESEPAAGAE